MTEHPQNAPPQPNDASSGNPADDRAFLKALHQQVDELATTIMFRDRDTIPARPSAADERARQIAAAWVYLSCVAVWAEDHHLVRPLLRRNLTGLDRTPTSGTLWLARAFQQLTVHPSTQWLMHPDYNPMLWAGTPHPHACHALIDWWATEAPTLAYPNSGNEPTSITGWVIGDLLPVLDPGQRTGAALVQTPYYVADFILERTLLPAAAEFHHEPVLRLIDPACGTGHFLIRAVDYLFA